MVLEEQPEKVAEAFMIFAQVPCLKSSWSVTKRPNKYKKRVLVNDKLNLLLKIILYNT
jgi:hypothetical protein